MRKEEETTRLVDEGKQDTLVCTLCLVYEMIPPTVRGEGLFSSFLCILFFSASSILGQNWVPTRVDEFSLFNEKSEKEKNGKVVCCSGST